MSGNYQTPERMAVKLAAVPLPELAGRTVLDVGCDHGAWCQIARERGAVRVLGLDRGRDGINLAVRNAAALPECEFREIEIGRQWHEFGRFDVVLMLNVYHHIYQLTADHAAIWYWLWKHTADELVWEAPVDLTDGVAAMHVTHPYRGADIRHAAERYFHVEDVGPGWVETRRVWRCIPRRLQPRFWAGVPRSGAGGATKAFLYADGRRMDEIAAVLGVRPIPGSLNVELVEPFDWDSRYYRAQILDVVDRGAGLDSEWAPRWARFYPMRDAWALRFEGESYPDTFLELISDKRLRDGNDVSVFDN